MSAETKQSLKLLAVLCSIALALIGIAKAGAYVAVIPERVEALERKASSWEKDHDMLQRIDERSGRMEKAIDRLLEHELKLSAAK